jgi:hypothetical protein
MAAKDRPGRPGEVELKGYLRRILEDDELRGTLISAYGAARSAYGRMSNGAASKELMEDPELQGELTQVAEALRDASSALREPPKRHRRGGGLGRSILFIAVAGLLAVALSKGLRAKVLDVLFGAEEEFDYSSTSTQAEPAPVGVPAA